MLLIHKENKMSNVQVRGLTGLEAVAVGGNLYASLITGNFAPSQISNIYASSITGGKRNIESDFSVL
jgi:hypothetical protein